jgi:hypothetical protein
LYIIQLVFGAPAPAAMGKPLNAAANSNLRRKRFIGEAFPDQTIAMREV